MHTAQTASSRETELDGRLNVSQLEYALVPIFDSVLFLVNVRQEMLGAGERRESVRHTSGSLAMWGGLPALTRTSSVRADYSFAEDQPTSRRVPPVYSGAEAPAG